MIIVSSLTVDGDVLLAHAAPARGGLYIILRRRLRQIIPQEIDRGEQLDIPTPFDIRLRWEDLQVGLNAHGLYLLSLGALPPSAGDIQRTVVGQLPEMVDGA